MKGWCSRRGRSGAAGAVPRWVTLGRPVLPGLVLLVAGCGGAAAYDALGPPPGLDPAREPVQVVAEFLEAANRRDHAAMAARFGTGDGPIRDQGSAFGCGLRRMGAWIGLGERCLAASEIELRMDLVARILAHESYRVGAKVGVVGRGRPASRVEVEVVRGGRGVVVPFVVILANDGRWLVEDVGLGGLVGSRRDFRRTP